MNPAKAQAPGHMRLSKGARSTSFKPGSRSLSPAVYRFPTKATKILGALKSEDVCLNLRSNPNLVGAWSPRPVRSLGVAKFASATVASQPRSPNLVRAKASSPTTSRCSARPMLLLWRSRHDPRGSFAASMSRPPAPGRACSGSRPGLICRRGYGTFKCIVKLFNKPRRLGHRKPAASGAPDRQGAVLAILSPAWWRRPLMHAKDQRAVEGRHRYLPLPAVTDPQEAVRPRRRAL